MNAVEILENGLDEVRIPYAEEKYYGKDAKYILYVEEDSRDRDFVDNVPTNTETFFQVHYFCPMQPKEMDDSRKVTVLIKKTLRKRGFCFTGVVRRIEENGKRHVIISCKVKRKMEE